MPDDPRTPVTPATQRQPGSASDEPTSRSPAGLDLGAQASQHRLGPALEFLRRLWRLDHALARLSSRMETRLGITAQQRLVIRCIGSRPRISAGQLAELMHVDPGTVSATLRRLERMGLVERHRDPADRRRVALVLTVKGLGLDGPTAGTVEEAVTELLAGSPDGTVEVAVEVIERLTALLDAKAGQ